MSTSPPTRKTYEHSCQFLQQQNLLLPGPIPPLPARRPTHDDPAPLGLDFFRTLLADAELSNLTLPRTFIGRSEIANTTFHNTDLSESTMCWNDFTTVDFSNASLADTDLRASTFKHVNFTNTSLCNADLRHATFINCNFTNTDLTAAKLTHSQAKQLTLSPSQTKSIHWHSTPGKQPPGG